MADRLNVKSATWRVQSKYLIVLVGLILLTQGEVANARTYSAAPFSGRVIDADTGEPIPGVIVLAQWIVEGPAEGHPVAALQIMEAVTDQKGRYSFAGWGPKSVPRPGFWSWLFTPVLNTRDPQVFFMKSGYAHAFMTNLPDGPPVSPEVELRRSRFDGRDISLKNLHDDLNARRRDFDILLLAPYGGLQGDCSWTLMPRTIAYLSNERAELQARGERPDMSPLVNTTQCGKLNGPT